MEIKEDKEIKINKRTLYKYELTTKERRYISVYSCDKTILVKIPNRLLKYSKRIAKIKNLALGNLIKRLLEEEIKKNKHLLTKIEK
jgi:hypothetical protein